LSIKLQETKEVTDDIIGKLRYFNTKKVEHKWINRFIIILQNKRQKDSEWHKNVIQVKTLGVSL
jgi:hypothetical protein